MAIERTSERESRNDRNGGVMDRSGTDRDKALDMALSQIDKQFGKGSIMRMGEKGSMAVEAIPTGALALDLALGVGGLPARARGGDLRAGVIRQVHAGHARRGRGAAQRRHLRLHRR